MPSYLIPYVELKIVGLFEIEARWNSEAREMGDSIRAWYATV